MLAGRVVVAVVTGLAVGFLGGFITGRISLRDTYHYSSLKVGSITLPIRTNNRTGEVQRFDAQSGWQTIQAAP
jgi:hypothetical protein